VGEEGLYHGCMAVRGGLDERILENFGRYTGKDGEEVLYHGIETMVAG
jgi:hypothetical protein